MKSIGFVTAFMTTHSVGLAGQFLAIALNRRVEVLNLSLIDGDHPWPTSLCGLDPEDHGIIQALTKMEHLAALEYRIDYGCPPVKLVDAKVTLHYFVSEFGNGVDTKSFNDTIARDSRLMVPSDWVKNLMINKGVHGEGIDVVHCGVSPKYFFRYTQLEIADSRTSIGLSPRDFVFLNVGAFTQNKGIDFLVTAFDAICARGFHAILILKDSYDLYGISARDRIHEFFTRGLVHESTLSRIKVISGNLTLQQLSALYNLADCYVSPYIAEGFNAPVLESIACGTPVIVTSGGPTDEFVFIGAGKKIDSRSVDSYQGVTGSFLIPSVEHLISLMSEEIISPSKFTNDFQNVSQEVVKAFSYDSIANRFINEVLI